MQENTSDRNIWMLLEIYIYVLNTLVFHSSADGRRWTRRGWLFTVTHQLRAVKSTQQYVVIFQNVVVTTTGYQKGLV